MIRAVIPILNGPPKYEYRDYTNYKLWCKSPDYDRFHQALSVGLQSCGHLRDACALMLGDLKVVRGRRRVFCPDTDDAP